MPRLRANRPDDDDIRDMLATRRDMATYELANWLNAPTDFVRRGLLRLERAGKVARVTGRRNPYARQLVWEVQPTERGGAGS